MAHAEHACAACGFRNRSTDRRIFWTMAPAPRRIASVLMVAIWLLTAGMIWWFMLGHAHMGSGAGYLMLTPLAVGAFLSGCARKITRHESSYSPLLVWLLSLGGMAIFLLFLWRDGDALPLPKLLRFESVIAGLAFVGWFIASRFGRWKARRIAGPARSGDLDLHAPDSNGAHVASVDHHEVLRSIHHRQIDWAEWKQGSWAKCLSVHGAIVLSPMGFILAALPRSQAEWVEALINLGGVGPWLTPPPGLESIFRNSVAAGGACVAAIMVVRVLLGALFARRGRVAALTALLLQGIISAINAALVSSGVATIPG